MKSLVLALAVVFAGSVYAAEPQKAPAKKPVAEKKCDPLKQKDCKKDAPSANKPVPKKKAETK